ncbi:MAG: hypothetical protein QOF09_3092 [Alphaproteobacteria bacterium]|jgi:hypothetical protein|nr:hypothetical protein [Alphaproteobacteria bacterium]
MFSPMPRYFFHVKDGDTVLDTVGMELPSVEDAKAEARRVVTMFKRPDPAAPPA